VKQCFSCSTKGIGPKHESEFSKCAKAPDGLQYMCKACHSERYARNSAEVLVKHRAWREANKDRSREYRRGWSKRNPISVTKKALKRQYGMSVADFEALYKKQNGCCAICGTSILSQITKTRAVDRTKVAHVDHCHSTKSVRGLLCFNCNIGLGKFKDDKELLLSAVRYLRASEVSTNDRRLPDVNERGMMKPATGPSDSPNGGKPNQYIPLFS